MAVNKKWYWLAGSVAVLVAAVLLRRKGVALWRRAMDHVPE